MKSVIIYGITSIKLRREIEFLQNRGGTYQIVGYSDSYYSEDVVDHKQYIAPVDICQKNVDYIVLAIESEKAQEDVKRYLIELGVSSDKIVIPVLLLSKEFANKQMLKDDISAATEDCYGLIFGLSYSRKGIISNRLTKPFYNFSKDGLDLYYNALVYRRLLEKRCVKNIKFALCVFPYYYFDYDMSRSLAQYESGQIFCAQGLGDWHNYEKCPLSQNYIANFELFGDGYASFYKSGHWQPIITTKLDATEQYHLEKIWYRDYDETVQENIQTLGTFLELLANEKIKVILVVPPMCLECYGEDDRMQILKKKEKFYCCLDLFIKKNKVEVRDYTDLFPDKYEYYYNPTHLNFAGSEKFTEVINELIEEVNRV